MSFAKELDKYQEAYKAAKFYVERYPKATASPHLPYNKLIRDYETFQKNAKQLENPLKNPDDEAQKGRLEEEQAQLLGELQINAYPIIAKVGGEHQSPEELKRLKEFQEGKRSHEGLDQMQKRRQNRQAEVKEHPQGKTALSIEGVGKYKNTLEYAELEEASKGLAGKMDWAAALILLYKDYQEWTAQADAALLSADGQAGAMAKVAAEWNADPNSKFYLELDRDEQGGLSFRAQDKKTKAFIDFPNDEGIQELLLQKVNDALIAEGNETRITLKPKTNIMEFDGRLTPTAPLESQNTSSSSPAPW